MIDDNPTPMILEELDENNRIPLDDGSIWEVDPGSVPTASTWSPASPVTVRPANEGSKYQYEITRNLDQHSIRARKVT